MIKMWLFMLILIILTLIFVYKKFRLLSKIFAVAILVLYTMSLWDNIMPVIYAIRDLITFYQIALLDIINSGLLIWLLTAIFKGKRKVAIWLLWSVLVIMILTNWNALLSYIVSLKNLFS